MPGQIQFASSFFQSKEKEDADKRKNSLHEGAKKKTFSQIAIDNYPTSKGGRGGGGGHLQNLSPVRQCNLAVHQVISHIEILPFKRESLVVFPASKEK